MTRFRPFTLYAALIVTFLVLRAGMFAVTTGSEYSLYKRYADAARAGSVAKLYRTKDVEYPHLAIVFAMAVQPVADALPDPVYRWVGWRPNKREPPE